jgi:hypothetical protein
MGNQNSYFMFNDFYVLKLYRLQDNVKKYGRTVQATDGNIIWSIRIALWKK